LLDASVDIDTDVRLAREPWRTFRPPICVFCRATRRAGEKKNQGANYTPAVNWKPTRNPGVESSKNTPDAS